MGGIFAEISMKPSPRRTQNGLRYKRNIFFFLFYYGEPNIA